MKITTGQLAQALLEAVEGKKEKEVGKQVANFVALLVREQMISRQEEIIAAFSRLWDERHGIVSAKVSVAHPLSEINRKRIAEYVKSRTGAKEVVLQEEEDKSRLGGVSIAYGDKEARASLREWIGELEAKFSN